MKKTLLSIAALSFVFSSTVAMAATPTSPAASTPATSGKHVKPAAKSKTTHHKAKKTAAKPAQ